MVAVLLRVQVNSMANLRLSDWAKPAIDGECQTQHGRYDRALALHYTRYFESHSELRGNHKHCAINIEAALPNGWSSLAGEIPKSERHRHHLSGKSSQLLGLGVLGVAVRLQPDLNWLWRAIGVTPDSSGLQIRFEHKLAADALGEQPRQTAVDFLVENSTTVVCSEIKWAEAGLGSCSCGRTDNDEDSDADPSIGECSPRILRRSHYWAAAKQVFGLPGRVPPAYCPISTAYQAVRNVAAARVLAGGRRAVFLLIYDANNPYFRATGEWPGWPAVLTETLLEDDRFRFRAIAWQDFIRALPLDEQTKTWAREKHQLNV